MKRNKLFQTALDRTKPFRGAIEKSRRELFKASLLKWGQVERHSGKQGNKQLLTVDGESWWLPRQEKVCNLRHSKKWATQLHSYHSTDWSKNRDNFSFKIISSLSVFACLMLKKPLTICLLDLNCQGCQFVLSVQGSKLIFWLTNP